MVIADYNIVATRFKQITSVHYQVVSHTENRNFEFILRSKKSPEITKN